MFVDVDDDVVFSGAVNENVLREDSFLGLGLPVVCCFCLTLRSFAKKSYPFFFCGVSFFANVTRVLELRINDALLVTVSLTLSLLVNEKIIGRKEKTDLTQLQSRL